jgi:DNA-binding CsgD family transcriptional regulator
MDSRTTIDALVERDAELAQLDSLSAAAAAGDGGLAVVVGEAGIGKTALLGAARATALDCGMRPLDSRGFELERTFPFGVVRQLVEPLLVTLTDDERAELFSGAAALARPVFEPVAPGPEPAPDFGSQHGLYWLFATLAQEQPLAILVDDVQWSDLPSLRFTQFLLRRIGGLPILVLAALRPGEPGDGAALAAELLDDPAATVIRPAPLSTAAVAELVHARLGDSADGRIADECHRATGGNPFYLNALLGELDSSGTIDVAGLGERGPEAVARFVRRRLATLGPNASSLVDAVAVLGDGVELRHAAELAGLDEPAASDAARSLADAGLLDGASFTHPIVRAALYAGLSEADRADLHARAARLLAAAGAPDDEVAAQLVHAAPGTDEQACALLTAAAREALGRGAPEVAAAYLERVLAEPLDASERVDVLLELGVAEMRAGRVSAVAHLEEAAREAPDPQRRMAAAIALTRVLYVAGEGARGIELLGEVRAAVGEDTPELDNELLSIADLDLAARSLALAQLGHDGRAAPDDSELGHFESAHRAVELLMSAESADRAAALAERALADGMMLGRALAGDNLFFLVNYVLIAADRYDAAQRHLEAARAAARDHGSAIAYATAELALGFLGSRRGTLVEAEAAARAGLEVAALNGWPPVAQMGIAVLADILLERGEMAELREAAAASGVELDTIDEGTQGTVLLDIRGQLRIAEGDTSGGAQDLLEAGERLVSWGMFNPTLHGWRGKRPLALFALGDESGAREQADELLRLAAGWGAPRTYAGALLTSALVRRGDEQIELLREAADTLDGSQAALVRAHVLTDLGAALRRANRRADAREPLREGLELARACGAEPLVHRAHTELWATGARPRTPLRSGLDALTPSERRVANMAAGGLSNPEIAQSLFVTIKTVEMHLTSAYRKLDIDSRGQLGAALSA